MKFDITIKGVDIRPYQRAIEEGNVPEDLTPGDETHLQEILDKWLDRAGCRFIGDHINIKNNKKYGYWVSTSDAAIASASS